MHAVAESDRAANEIRSSEPYIRLSIKLKEYGSDHPSVADTLNSFAMSFQKDLSPHVGYYNKALDIRERYLGNEHPAVAQTLNSLAGGSSMVSL